VSLAFERVDKRLCGILRDLTPIEPRPAARDEVNSGMTEPKPDDAPESGDREPVRKNEGPFSLEALRQLVRMMEKHGLTEVSLKSGETHWKLRRGPEPAAGFGGYPAGYAPPMPVPPTVPAAPAASAASAAPAGGSPASAPAAQEGVFIKSPTVGTFYAAAGPDDPPFVSVGTRVQPDTIVCLIEAMKVFNQIPAEVSGVIAEVLCKNGDSVEYGQPLFRVTPG
jgi:acetyl-CoA carboxylase biotin carboxyl carrier protein